MADDVRLNINITGDGDDSPKAGDSIPSNPFEGIEPLTKEDLLDVFPPKEDFKSIFDTLKSASFKDFLESKNAGKSLEDIFKDLPELSKATSFDSSIVGGLEKDFRHLEETIQAFDSSIVGFLPEDFEEGLDNFFKAIQEDTDAFNAQKKALDDLLEQQNDALESLFSEIGKVIGSIVGWIGAIGKGIAVFTGFIVSVSLFNNALKEVLNSLGEYAANFRREQALVARDLQLQSLRNSQRLDEQLSANEANRGELAQALEQFKTEMFDLLSPFIRFITATLTIILNVINLILAAINLVKDALELPIKLLSYLGELLLPVSQKAKKDLQQNTTDPKDSVGLGTVFDLFDMDNFDLNPNDLPEGLRNDVIQHPFGDAPSPNPGGGNAGGGWSNPNGGGGF